MRHFLSLLNNNTHAPCTLTDQHTAIGLSENSIRCYTAHLVSVTASVVYGLYKELAPEREEEYTPLPPSG